MQRRHFMKLTGMLATLPAIKGIAATSEKPAPSGKQLYEWRIYTLEGDADGLDGFFRDTLIPAYNRKKIKAGAFVPYKKEEKERRLLLFIYPNITTYHRVKRTIWATRYSGKRHSLISTRRLPTRLTSISKVSCAKLSTKYLPF